MHLGSSQYYRGLFQLASNGVDLIAFQRACTGFDNPCCNQSTRNRSSRKVCTAFETVRSISMKSMSLRGFPHRHRIEPCRLNQDIFRFPGDHGVESTHNSRERDGFLGVGNDQVFGVELAVYAI